MMISGKLTLNRREPAGVDAIDWAKNKTYIGEIMLTSINKEGTKRF